MYKTVPREELVNRCYSLQESMEEAQLSGLLITHSMDLYYYSGSIFNGLFFLPQRGDPQLLVKKSIRRVLEDSSYGKVVPIKGMKELPALLDSPNLLSLGLTMDVLPAAIYTYLQYLFPTTKIEDISSMVRHGRMVKSEYEIKILKRAGQLLEKGFLFLKDHIELGQGELELSMALENFLREGGHHGYIRARSPQLELFFGQIASGENAAYPSFFDGPVAGRGLNSAIPHGSGEKKIKAYQPILADYCAQVEGYIVDQTRVFVIGELPPSLEEANQMAVELLEILQEEAKVGTSTKELYELILSRVKKEGLLENFMGFGPDQSRFIGHGVGLELDEFPIITNSLDFTLREGMVLALEPKFVFPKIGAVGIENTYYIGREGLVRLTSTPNDPSFFRLP